MTRSPSSSAAVCLELVILPSSPPAYPILGNTPGDVETRRPLHLANQRMYRYSVGGSGAEQHYWNSYRVHGTENALRNPSALASSVTDSIAEILTPGFFDRPPLARVRAASLAERGDSRDCRCRDSSDLSIRIVPVPGTGTVRVCVVGQPRVLSCSTATCVSTVNSFALLTTSRNAHLSGLTRELVRIIGIPYHFRWQEFW